MSELNGFKIIGSQFVGAMIGFLVYVFNYFKPESPYDLGVQPFCFIATGFMFIGWNLFCFGIVPTEPLKVEEDVVSEQD